MILPKIVVKKILYATDLSENSRPALAYAVSLANLYGAGITILHALDESPGMETAVMNYIGEERWAEIKKQNEESAIKAIIGKKREDDPAMKSSLKTFYKSVSEDYEDQSFELEEMVVKRGDPADLILEVSETHNCDLIVMGTQGRGGLAKMMLGSTAQKVLKRSKKPVLVVRLSDLF
jgi:nucleotide-binding universal stress UspA family protein